MTGKELSMLISLTDAAPELAKILGDKDKPRRRDGREERREEERNGFPRTR